MSVATVSQNAVVDAANSSTTLLGAAGTFTGRAEDVSIYAAVNVFAFSDQAGTLFVEFSIDGTNWDKSNSYAVSASTANSQSLAPPAQFVRIRYVNGATPQTSFRLQTFYQPISPAAASSVLGAVTANQGTAGALAGGWPVKVTDGVNTMPTGDVAARALFHQITDGTNTAAVVGTALKVDGSAVTQPVSAASLPLPTGAATEATLATRLADATFTARINTLGQNTMAASTPVVIASDQSAVPISAASLPLPSGAATAANQTTLGSQTTKLNDGTTTVAVTLANALKVDGSAVTQPVSGTVTANVGTTGGLALDVTLTGGTQKTRITDGTNDAAVSAANALKVDGSAVTQPVSVASLPLPAGAATATNQTTLGNQTSKINDGTTTVAVTLANALKVDGSAVTQPVSGTVTANIGTSGALALDATLTGGTQTSRLTDGTNTAAVSAANALKVDGSAVTQPVSAAALPLPAGAATEATLATRLADATFTARINTLGQKAMAASTPIVIASDQSAVPISAASLPLPAGAATEATLATRASDRTTAAAPFSNRLSDGAAFYDATKTGQLPSALVGGRLDTNLGAWLGSTAPTVGSKTSANSVPVVIASDQGAVAVSAASLPLPSGASTAANQTTLGSQTTKINDGTNTASVTAASALKVDGSAVTQPISAASLPLPTGASTDRTTAAGPFATRLSDGAAFYDATKTGQLPTALVGARLDTNVGAWLGSTAPTVGQKTAANSLPIILASDQGALPVNVVGAHANAWSAAAVGAGGNSASIDCQYTPHISAFGTSNGNTTISLQVSQDDTNFYTAATATVGGGGGDFALNLTIGARYIRLQSSQARTITATIAGKD